MPATVLKGHHHENLFRCVISIQHSFYFNTFLFKNISLRFYFIEGGTPEKRAPGSWKDLGPSEDPRPYKDPGHCEHPGPSEDPRPSDDPRPYKYPGPYEDPGP